MITFISFIEMCGISESKVARMETFYHPSQSGKFSHFNSVDMLKNPNFKKFIIKYAVIATAMTWLIAGRVEKLVMAFSRSFMEPLFSIDLNNDGEPDLKQIKEMVIFGKFPIGIFVLEILKTVLCVVIIWLIINYIFKKSKLL